MPELPEVEVSRLGISPHMQGRTIAQLVIRQSQLRWPVPEVIHLLEGQVIEQISRRGKYLLLQTSMGTAVLHLGMSGRLRVIPAETPAAKHDHVDIVLDNGMAMRLTDPRRFGALLFQPPGQTHELLKKLGPEPLSDAFDAEYLWPITRKRTQAIKQLIMNAHIVVGVGNIYANEALFLSGIQPTRSAGSLKHKELDALIERIKQVLAAAIAQGGTTLKDFAQVDGNPGYFAQTLHVYGRGDQPCVQCGELLTEIRLGQRSTVYCRFCQK